MAKISIYLNFDGETEAAFAFYKSVFGTDYAGPVVRIGDIPSGPGQERTEAQKQRIANVGLPILGGTILHGSDMPSVTRGNGMSIMLEPDTKAEADRLFAALGEGGAVEMPMQDQFWGAYFGQLRDKFGVSWLVNVDAPTA
jgi:PhnB protein